MLKLPWVAAVSQRDLDEFTARWIQDQLCPSTVCPGLSQRRVGERGRPPIDGQGHGTPSPHPRPSLRLYPPVFMGEQQFNQPNTKCVNPEMMMSERVCRQHKHLVSLPWFTMIHYQQQLRFRALAFVVRMICG